MKIYRVQRRYHAASLGITCLLMLGFFFADKMLYALGAALAFCLILLDKIIGQRQFATINDDGILTIYGLFRRISWQHSIDETQFTYQRIFMQNQERHHLLLQHSPTQQSKKITLNTCEYKGLGLLMDLNDLAATPFFQKIDQHCHSESLNWKNAQKQH